MLEKPRQVDELFDEALRRRPGVERERYLDDACGKDSDLRRRVERLLRAVADAGSFLESPAQDPSPTLDQPPLEGKKLTLPHEMGELFKVIAFARGVQEPLPGFTLQDRRGRL